MGSFKSWIGILGGAAMAMGIVACSSMPTKPVTSAARATETQDETALDNAGWAKATDRAVLVSAEAPTGSLEAFQGLTGYRSWRRANGSPVYIYSKAFAACANVEPMTPHEGGYINVFVNPTGQAAFLNSKNRVPVGTIVVKEKREKPDSPPIALTVMTKIADEGDVDDWQFATYSGDAKERLPGNDPSCRTCHRGANTDHLFRHYLKPDTKYPPQ